MKNIAVEEAFSIPGLADPMPGLSSRATPYAEQWLRKLPDFTEYRLPEMDATGIDIQVLSLTVPGLQADLGAGTAREDARRANDYLAEVVSKHPTRFQGFAALPLQDPQDHQPRLSAAAACIDLSRHQHRLHHQRRLLPRRRLPALSWRSEPTPSCSPSITPMSLLRRPSRDSSAQP